MSNKISLEELSKVKGIGKKTIQRVRQQMINDGQIKKKTIEEVGFPEKKYDVIYADPPWAYNESGTGDRVISSKYPTMQIKEIKELPVEEISKENCLLFCWVTFPRLEEGIEVIRGWGFKYYSLGFNWIKENKKSDTLFWGMGYYTRQNPEICLIGLKGKIKPQDRGVHSVIKSKIEEHSKKPDETRKLIEKIVGEEKDKIELFARQRVEGWDCWGNEV